MSALLIKKMPEDLHERLRQKAAEHHRSMNKEVIAILERELGHAQGLNVPPPVKGLKTIDGKWVAEGIRKDRDVAL